jgi:serine/threonine protein phosphatase PrpC
MAENFYGVTNTGRIRENNEDTFLAEKLPNGWIAACVIDGVGGYEGGEVAAEIARSTIREKLQQLAPDPIKTLREGILQANLNIYNEKFQRQGSDQMACVLTLAVVDVEANHFIMRTLAIQGFICCVTGRW